MDRDIWALRVRLQMANWVRELALLNLGIDSKLRGCDLVKLKVGDVCHGEQIAAYGTHSIRRTKATLIYRRTKNLRAVQLLPGHTKLERRSATLARGERRVGDGRAH